MQSFNQPGGVDYSEQRTVPPVGAPPAVKPAASQFGVEDNQVGMTVATLEQKAAADLAAKIGFQATSGYNDYDKV